MKTKSTMKEGTLRRDIHAFIEEPEAKKQLPKRKKREKGDGGEVGGWEWRNSSDHPRALSQ